MHKWIDAGCKTPKRDRFLTLLTCQSNKLLENIFFYFLLTIARHHIMYRTCYVHRVSLTFKINFVGSGFFFKKYYQTISEGYYSNDVTSTGGLWDRSFKWPHSNEKSIRENENRTDRGKQSEADLSVFTRCMGFMYVTYLWYTRIY